MNPPRRGKCSFRDSTRLCRVALLRVFRRLHCSAALPNAPLRFLRRWRRSAFRRPGCAVSHCFADFRRLHCSAALPNAPLRFLRHWRRSAFRRPGCAVSHCFADFRRLHCSAALPNAPLRFLRHWRRSASHTRDPHQCADGVRASKYIEKSTNIFITPHHYTAFSSPIREKGHFSVTFFDRLKPPTHVGGFFFGAPSGTRTRDPLIKSQLLSQLTNTNGVVKIPHVVLLPKTAYKFLAHGL